MEIWVVKGNRFPKAEIRFVFLNFLFIHIPVRGNEAGTWSRRRIYSIQKRKRTVHSKNKTTSSPRQSPRPSADRRPPPAEKQHMPADVDCSPSVFVLEHTGCIRRVAVPRVCDLPDAAPGLLALNMDASCGEPNCEERLDGFSIDFDEFVQKTLRNSGTMSQGFDYFDFTHALANLHVRVYRQEECEKRACLGHVNKVALDLIDRGHWRGNLLLACFQTFSVGLALSATVHNPREFVRLADIEDADYIAEDKMLAFAMIKHDRLGGGARARMLSSDILRLVFEGPNAEVFAHSSWALRCLFQAMRQKEEYASSEEEQESMGVGESGSEDE